MKIQITLEVVQKNISESILSFLRKIVHRQFMARYCQCNCTIVKYIYIVFPLFFVCEYVYFPSEYGQRICNLYSL